MDPWLDGWIYLAVELEYSRRKYYAVLRFLQRFSQRYCFKVENGFQGSVLLMSFPADSLIPKGIDQKQYAGQMMKTQQEKDILCKERLLPSVTVHNKNSRRYW